MLAAAGCGLAFLLLHLVGGLGFGDVKLAPLLGALAALRSCLAVRSCGLVVTSLLGGDRRGGRPRCAAAPASGCRSARAMLIAALGGAPPDPCLTTARRIRSSADDSRAAGAAGIAGMTPRTIVLTGASSGIGEAAARRARRAVGTTSSRSGGTPVRTRSTADAVGCGAACSSTSPTCGACAAPRRPCWPSPDGSTCSRSTPVAMFASRRLTAGRHRGEPPDQPPGALPPRAAAARATRRGPRPRRVHLQPRRPPRRPPLRSRPTARDVALPDVLRIRRLEARRPPLRPRAGATALARHRAHRRRVPSRAPTSTPMPAAAGGWLADAGADDGTRHQPTGPGLSSPPEQGCRDPRSGSRPDPVPQHDSGRTTSGPSRPGRRSSRAARHDQRSSRARVWSWSEELVGV